MALWANWYVQCCHHISVPYFNAGTGTGGSNSHTLSINELAKHNHHYAKSGWLMYWGPAGNGHENAKSTWVNNGEWCITAEDSRGTGKLDPYNFTQQTAGNSSAHNNMPSYQTLYAWRRTA